MTAAALKQALALIPNMEHGELNKLVEAIRAAQSLGGLSADSSTAVGGLSDDELMVMNAIVQYVNDRAIDRSSLGMYRRWSGFNTFRGKVPALCDYMRSAKLVKNQRYALCYIGAGLVHQSLVDIGAPVSGRAIMNHIHRLPSLIDKQFPGYAELGMLKFVVASSIIHKKEKSGVRDE